MLLGIGAPAGASLLRLAKGVDLAAEWRLNAFFYLYMLVATSLVFAVTGFAAGLRADRLRESRNRYYSLAEKDDLTHLPNRRAFDSHLSRALEHAAAFREPLSLLLVDLDSLKSINDRWGHEVGSASLRHVGRLLFEAKRQEDFAARWGGDEFTILMPGADTRAASRVARTILEKTRSSAVEHGGKSYPLTVTIGVATTHAPAPDLDLFALADRALYKGKLGGRNQFRAAPGGRGGLPPPPD